MRCCCPLSTIEEFLMRKTQPCEQIVKTNDAGILNLDFDSGSGVITYVNLQFFLFVLAVDFWQIPYSISISFSKDTVCSWCQCTGKEDLVFCQAFWSGDREVQTSNGFQFLFQYDIDRYVWKSTSLDKIRILSTFLSFILGGYSNGCFKEIDNIF
jgi:hypothetical protein